MSTGPYTHEHFKVEPAEIAEGWRVNMGDEPHLVFGDRADAAMTAAALRHTANRAFLAGQASREQWISVETRLPEPYVPVLCYTRGGDVVRDRYDGITLKDGTHQFHGDREEWRFDVTHWQPLPEPPSPPPTER